MPKTAPKAPWVVPKPLYPSDLLRWLQEDNLIPGETAVDTETSGLFVDDGARCSTVSIAFVDIEGAWIERLGFEYGQLDWGGGIYARRLEVIDDELSLPVVSFAWPYDQGVAGTGKAEDNGYLTMWPDADNLSLDEWRDLLEWLYQVGALSGLVMHHAKFDLHILREGVRRWPGVGRDLQNEVIWDTQNGVAAVWPTMTLVFDQKTKSWKPTTSLKPNSEELWGKHESDEQQVIRDYLRRKKLPSGRWDLMPWDIIAKYAMHDAVLTIRMYWRQLRDIRAGKAPWLGTYDEALARIQRRLDTSKMLYRMEKRGLPFNIEKAEEYSALLKRRIHELEQKLPFSPPTLNRAKEYWHGPKDKGGLGIAPYETTGKGAPSITEAVIDKMVAINIPGAKEWRDLQKAKTADSRWYEGWASMCGSDGRLRCSIRQNGTVSSRFSVERIQLQAIPQDYRLSGFSALEGIPTPRALISAGVPKGWKLWELDLAQAELRVGALFAGCQSMLDAIMQGSDLHGLTATQLFEAHKGDDDWDFKRNIAKRGNFSLIFGVGWATFDNTLDKEVGIRLGEKEATRLVVGWNKIYPEFKRAIYRHQNKVEQRMAQNKGVGWIDLVNGERRWFTPGEETHKAFNQRVQPNLAQFGIDWWLWSEKYLMDIYGDEPVIDNGVYVGRVGMLLTIHDSQVLLLPDTDEAREQVATIQQYGRDLWAQRFPGVPGEIDAKEWGK